MKKRIGKGMALGLILGSAPFLALPAAHGATIIGIETRGGGCVGDHYEGHTGRECTNVSYSFGLNGDGTRWFDIAKNFSKVEEESSEEESCGGQGQGGISGGHEEEETDDHEFERLSPIHLFLTLENSGQANTYSFTESITNGMEGQEWIGFLHALKGTGVDEGATYFQSDPEPWSSSSFDYLLGGEEGGQSRLQWTGSMTYGDEEIFNFAIAFGDLEDAEDGRYQVLLQEFPLVAKTDTSEVPLPATFLLFGSGLSGLAGISRKRKKK